MSEHRHRSGDLHQQNKGFKGGKHDSKGAIKRRAQGKIETNGARQSIKNLAIVNNKDAMRQKHQKLVKSKKNELLERKRLGLPDQVAPRVVVSFFVFLLFLFFIIIIILIYFLKIYFF